MIKEAEEFAQLDRQRRERVEKRNRARALADQAQRRLREVALDFGSQFANRYRQDIDNICKEILDALEKEDDRRLDKSIADLEDVLYELNREARLQYKQEEGEGFFESIKKTFMGDDEEEYDWRRQRQPNPRYGNRDYPANYSPRDNGDSYPSANPPRYKPEGGYRIGKKNLSIPYENDWDDDDDW